MRKINKSIANSKEFERWIASHKPADWPTFVRTHHDEYLSLRNKLAEEQCQVSAYTEKPLNANVHIDHFRKRALYPKLTFDYRNLFVDHGSANYGAGHKDFILNRCSDFDGPERIFNPSEEDFAESVDFNLRGAIIPRCDVSAEMAPRIQKTIAAFNLNHPELMSQRACVIENVRTYLGTGLFSDDDICLLLKDVGFFSTVQWALSVFSKYKV